ncbi:MAG TPA: GNAT family N-acetyltransferase [Gaiellaceae bacterium]|nr:GNAT family N-acetyltransferase [Gaiellaceae bacterium]
MELIRVSSERDREALRRIYPLYLHDLSQWSSHYRLDEDGRWQPSYVEDFLGREQCAAFLIREDGAAAGFAWVGGGDFPRKRPDRDWRLAEFFVAAPFRRRGIGRAAAAGVLDSFSGSWQLEVIDGNEPALRFWREVLAARGTYEEEPGDGDLVFTFRSVG